jgi:L-asparaginase
LKHILIIHTGGTFGMVPMEPSATLAPGAVQHELLAHIPEIARIAEIDTDVAFNLDSSNMNVGHWQALARMIADRREAYDGFVLIHGTDTMAYTASALSFMLRGLGKPVVLTGAQRPLVRIRSDARGNLVNAVEIATTDLAEVAVFFGTRLYRGNRTTKISADRYDAFASPNAAPLAEVGVDIRFAADVRRAAAAGPFDPFFDLDPAVCVLVAFPGMRVSFWEQALASDIRAYIVEGYGPGNVPITGESLLPFVERAVAAGKLVAINTQCAEGRVDLDLYECGRRAAELGALSCADMTVEASIVKAMYLLGRSRSTAEAARLFVSDLAGECSPPPQRLAESNAGRGAVARQRP